MSAQTEGRGQPGPVLLSTVTCLAMDTDWMDQASCRNEDTNLFYPTLLPGPGTYTKVDRTHIEEAKAICARCPVRDACLDYAMRRKERYGIWGGLLPSERFPRRRRKIA